jgi:predicted metal-dependent hydrolase
VHVAHRFADDGIEQPLLAVKVVVERAADSSKALASGIREMPPMQNLAAAVQAGLVHFQGGDFHAAHEAWEQGWRIAQGPERHLLQALAQLAAAFHHWSRRKPTGAATLFVRARGHLSGIPSTLLGVEVSELELELGAWEEAATRGEAMPAAPRLRALEPSSSVPKHPHRPRCPYCGERVTVQADVVGVVEESYVEDCPVCCRPWTVHVTRDGSEVAVTLGREDD